MQVTVQPTLSHWQPSRGAPADWPALAAVANERAARLRTPRLSQAVPVFATGHQPWLWHPGILAKFLAAAAQARRFGGQALHLVVDHDVHPALELEIPRHQGEWLSVRKVALGPQDAAVPAACQPPVDPRRLEQALSELHGELAPALAEGLERLRAAFEGLPECRSLAEQLAVVLTRLMQPCTGPMPLVMATDFAQLETFRGLVDRMRDDALACITAYNRAAAQHPVAGIAPLAMDETRVELPLWSLVWQRPRRRVFATRTPPARLVLENGEPADPAHFAPRALLLTAVLRARLCNFFIHGRGGGLYEPVAEAWWSQWTREALAPMAVVSADLHLNLDAPLADVAELRRAQWFAHHLPHNLDRVLALDGPAVQEKRTLLATMNAHRDRACRFATFAQIHRINRHLAAEHPQAIERASQELVRARAGVANRAIAARRDWCFALYPFQQLARLAQNLSL